VRIRSGAHRRPRSTRRAAPVALLVSLLALSLLALSLLGGCGPDLRGTVSAERLRPVVERDLLVFDVRSLPSEMLDRLAASDVLVVGEFHGITEHDAFVGELVVALHAHGFRVVLLEYPNAYGWLLDGYARGLLDTPGEAALRTYGPLLERIRAFNAELPANAQVRVHAIDANLHEDDFLPPFRGLMHQLGRPTILTEAVAAIESGASREAVLAALERALARDQEDLVDAWSERGFERVRDMIDAERRSLAVRAVRAGRARDEAREAVMTTLTDRELQRADGGVLVNVGYYHAQKTSRDGTVRTWLGEHLALASPHAQGRTLTLVVVPASGEKVFGAGVRTFDVATDSPVNELFRVMRGVAGTRPAFLALDDPLFRDERVVVSYLTRLDTEPPRAVFDAFVLLPEVRPVEP
jgi:hypothetical protein